MHAAARKLPGKTGTFVASAGSDQPFRLVDGQIYAKIGDNASLAPQPSVVHFGGYEVFRVHRQKITVVNKSTVSRRLHIIHPTTPFFRLKCDRKGILAPGMAEEISIEFEPNEWRSIPRHEQQLPGQRAAQPMPGQRS